MRFTIKLVIEDDCGKTTTGDVININRGVEGSNTVGLTLDESKYILKSLQKNIVLQQCKDVANASRACPHCKKKRKLKDYKTIQYRTLFGIISIPSPRLLHCKCNAVSIKTCSPLNTYLAERNSPELQYIETKWASLMSYKLAATLLQDILPIHQSLNAATIRNHLHKIAKRQEKELEGKPACVSGCGNEWRKLARPAKPITVGIDGGYLKEWHKKNNNFEIIVGKSYSATQSAKRFGMVDTIDNTHNNSKRRLMDVLVRQGMQANQQITFLSDGADNDRELQFIMHPESEHILDWFHITMRLTVLNQFAQGLENSDPDKGAKALKVLKSTKWYLWHGNVKEALAHIEECSFICDNDEVIYFNKSKMLKHLDEFTTYIENNSHLIPNYGERWRYGEAITTSFVESTVNEVVSKRMAKKQQMQWTQIGAHYMLQTRTAVLNNELQWYFGRWYHGFNSNNINETKKYTDQIRIAA